MENLLISWQEFLRGKKKRQDVARFSIRFIDNIFKLHSDLLNRTYRHGQYYAFKINDPKPRDIHKAKVRDRILHHAVYRMLYPYFDKKFIYDSYSCRNDKGTHKAIDRFRFIARKVSHSGKRAAWILKGDMRKFFATINHEVLKDILRRHIKDENIIWLWMRLLIVFVLKSVQLSVFPLVM